MGLKVYSLTAFLIKFRNSGLLSIKLLYVTLPHMSIVGGNVSVSCDTTDFCFHNKSFRRIENKKAVPSLQGLFYICEYFGITPQEFFDEGNAYPDRLAELVEDMKQLDEKALSLLAELAKQLLRKK